LPGHPNGAYARALPNQLSASGTLFVHRMHMALKPQNQLTDLLTYAGAFVTVRQLSEYWDVSRKHVLKLIESGCLESIRLGPKTYRVRVQAAVAFERRSRSGELLSLGDSSDGDTRTHASPAHVAIDTPSVRE